ncbi:MAG: flippase [Flavobacteriales bacterium]|jgi:O-antigen/teichoic acid export membrane protein|nr:flippase [Flavobacteriales bacterium]
MIRSEGFRRYLTNTSWMFVERIVRLVVVLGTGILVARYLGPSLFGQLNYATGFVGIFFALTTMGLDEIVVRELVRDPQRRNELLGSAATLRLLGALTLIVLVLVSAWVKGMDGITASLVVVIALAELFKPLGVVDWHFQAEVRARPAVMVQMAQVLGSALIKVALVYWQAPLIWFAWVYVIENVLMGVGYLMAYSNDGSNWRQWRVTRKELSFLLNESWPLIIFGMALYVQAKIDQVMIGDMLRTRLGEDAANAEVGQYSNALKMIEALGFLPVIVQKSLAPAITRAKALDRAQYEDRLLNQYRLMFLMFLITAIPLYLVAEPMMVLLFGEEFRPSGVLLSLFAIRLFFTNMGVGKSSFITNESLFKYSLITGVVGAGTNIIMNYFLIPPFKSVGAIWATIGSFTISIFLMDLLFKNTRANFKWMVHGILTFWKINKAG